MVHKDELQALEQRAHAARISMAELCKLAGKHRQSWHRAKKRGRAEYTLVKPLEDAMAAVEAQQGG